MKLDKVIVPTVAAIMLLTSRNVLAQSQKDIISEIKPKTSIEKIFSVDSFRTINSQISQRIFSNNDLSFIGSRDLTPQEKGINIIRSKPEINAGISFIISGGTQGTKLGINASATMDVGFYAISAGLGASINNNYLGMGINGGELRLSTLARVGSKKNNISLGSNLWTGFGDLKEFKQQTGIFIGKIGDFNLVYENDCYPLNKLNLNDGNDSYRTSAFQIGYKNVELLMKLFSGRRDQSQYVFDLDELAKNGNVTGEFGEFYKYGLVDEQSFPYRYGGLTFKINNIHLADDSFGPISLEFGVNSEWIKHYTQNWMHTLKPQHQFKMMNDDILSNFQMYYFPRFGDHKPILFTTYDPISKKDSKIYSFPNNPLVAQDTKEVC